MVSDKLYGRMMMGCICGHVSRSMSEEARDRHNFPVFCRKPKEKKRGAQDERRARDDEKPQNDG